MGGHIVQYTSTVVARVEDVAQTRRVLDQLAADRAPTVPGTAPQPKLFAGQELGVHFGRVVLLEEPKDSRWPSSIVLESNFDSTDPDRDRALKAHFETLARVRGDELRALFAGSPEIETSNGSLVDSLLGKLTPSTAEYQGRVYRDLSRIRIEEALHDTALDVVTNIPGGVPLPELRERVRDEIRRRASDPKSLLYGIDLDEPPPALPDARLRSELLRQGKLPWVVNFLRLLGGHPVLGLLLAVPTLPVWGSWLTMIAYRAAADPQFDLQGEAERLSPEIAARLRENDATEDHVMHNALTHLVPLKRGLFGSRSVRFLHRYINLMARNYFNYIEQLGGIPSIHFAKWLLIDGGERLLFLSNYDASWESYLGDFVDQAAIGLNLAWCLTEDYPKSHLFYRGGANDEERFKAWARAHQRPTQLFYSAAPTRSLSSINNATWLRHALHKGGQIDHGWVRRLT